MYTLKSEAILNRGFRGVRFQNSLCTSYLFSESYTSMFISTFQQDELLIKRANIFTIYTHLPLKDGNWLSCRYANEEVWFRNPSKRMSANRLWSLLSFVLVYLQIECKKSTRQLPSTLAYNSLQYQDQSLSIFSFALYYMLQRKLKPFPGFQKDRILIGAYMIKRYIRY